MARNFQILRDQLRSDPETLARDDEYRRAMNDALALGALLKSKESQVKNGDNCSSSEFVNQVRGDAQNDLYLATLSEYVSELGGRLELIAVFPDETVHLFPRD